MPSSNLNIDFISTQQSQKELTINVAIQTLDTAIAGQLVRDVTYAPAVLALEDAECANPYLKFTGAPGQPVAITVPARPRLWVVENVMAGPNSSLVLKTEAHDGVTVATGTKVVAYCDGVSVSFLGTEQSALSDMQAAVSGYLVKSLDGVANTALSDADALNAFLTFTGAPAAGATVGLPAVARFWIIDSQTTGANAAVSVKTQAGAAVVLPAGPIGVYSDGAKVTVVSDLSGLLARVAVLEGQGASSHSLASQLVKDISGLGATINLTAAEADNNILTFTGTTTGAVTVIVPAVARSWTIENKATSARITVKTQAGSGVYLPPIGPNATYTIQAYCDDSGVKAIASNLTAYHAQFCGKPAAGQAVIGYVSSGKTMLPKSMQHAYRLGVAPADSPGFNVRKVAYSGGMPGDIVGVFQIYANYLYGTFAPTSDVTLADGDFLYVEAPATTDAALSDIFMTLNFVRLD